MKKKAYIWTIPILMLLVGSWALWDRRAVLETDTTPYFLCGACIAAGILLVGSWAYSKTKTLGGKE